MLYEKLVDTSMQGGPMYIGSIFHNASSMRKPNLIKQDSNLHTWYFFRIVL